MFIYLCYLNRSTVLAAFRTPFLNLVSSSMAVISDDNMEEIGRILAAV
jgi:hypothetical protein